MNTSELKKFAQWARRTLIEQAGARMSSVLEAGSAERREFPTAVSALEREIRNSSEAQVVERAAYVWFNRLSALMFMDANGYTAVRAVSPNEGQTRPALLSDAMAGHIDEALPQKVRERALALLTRSAPSREPEAEAYRLLLVAVCNQWHDVMPFMFEKIADWTELLMPVDLLSSDSILANMREVMTEDACQDVEIIGWLYQFYISEKKDQVFAGLKKNVKITAENIPAATQLFTPHWIVRYLVENSLGRLWLLNRPQSRLAERMDYYIAPEEPETDFLKITKPEDIRICDPACGSGHMLTYAFDLLYAIYEEEGYDATEIPALILTHNLTGVEIDDRAGALAAFALAMKAAAKLGRRRFLRMAANPDICVLQNVAFTEAEVVRDVAAVVGTDRFTDELRETLGQFEPAKNFGSLIVPKLRDPAETLRVVEAREFAGDLLLKDVQERVVAVLRMAEALSPKYHVVVANPPYKGRSDLNKALAGWLDEKYPDSKTDLFSAFIERGLNLIPKNAYSAMVTMESWMFLDSFKKLREKALLQNSVLGMTHMPYLGKGGTPMGISFGTSAFIIRKSQSPDYKAEYVYVRHYETDDNFVPLQFPIENERRTKISVSQLMAVPDIPIAYWATENLRNVFNSHSLLRDEAPVKKGIDTGKNDQFLRFWFEVSEECRSMRDEKRKWFDYVKGGEFRKWYGNIELTVNWLNDGSDVRAHPSSTIRNPKYFLKPAVTWSLTGNKGFGARIIPKNCMFDNNGSSVFPRSDQLGALSCFLNSKVANHCLEVLNPTVAYQVGDIARLPYAVDIETGKLSEQFLELGKSDWDAYETSWDFTTLPLLQPDNRAETLEATYTNLRAHWQGMTDDMQRLEEENNRIFIDAYGLQDELTPEVPLNEITLTCNPAYRYGIKNDAAANESRLRADTMAEFLSYAVGCMFGRYSLDTPGLILANQGETLADHLARVPEPSFMPDEDNVIPVLDADWFADDITERFRLFLRVTFGEEAFQENLAFVEEALGKDIRKYFTRDFYADHVKRYKKRPIYWMFSSRSGSFNALIYMHRYQPDTVSVILNDYLRDFRSKLQAHFREQEAVEVSGEASAGEKTKALKEKDRVNKILRELDSYERDVLFPLAEAKLTIDLDDGVKVNYPKFGTALAPIKGLSD